MTVTFLLELNTDTTDLLLLADDIKDVLDINLQDQVVSVKPWARPVTGLPAPLGGLPPASPGSSI